MNKSWPGMINTTQFSQLRSQSNCIRLKVNKNMKAIKIKTPTKISLSKNVKYRLKFNNKNNPISQNLKFKLIKMIKNVWVKYASRILIYTKKTQS